MRLNTEQLISRYTSFLVDHSWRVLFVALIVMSLSAFGVRSIEFTPDYKVYFGKENPDLTAFQDFENIYTKTENILFVLRPKFGDKFNKSNLTIVHELTKKAWQTPYSIRVDSITNYQHTQAQEDDLYVADLVENPTTLSNSEIDKIRNIALSEPVLLNRLISADGTTTGVLVTLQFPGDDHTLQLPEAVNYARELAEITKNKYPDLTVALTGIAVFSDTEVQVSHDDLMSLVPFMYGIMIILIFVLLRSFYGTVITLIIVSFSVSTAMGLSGWIGIKLNASSSLAPIIILTLAIADSIHILLTLFDEMRHGHTRRDAIINSVVINAEPVFLTSLTTGIGFLSLNFSETPPFNDLGNIAAMGIGAAWLYSMTVLPALCTLMPIRITSQNQKRDLPMDKIGRFVVNNQKLLLISVCTIVLFFVSFTFRIEIDDRFNTWFDESVPFRIDTEFAFDNLSGLYNMEYSLPSREPGGIQDPAYLRQVDKFATWLRKQPEVVNVSSFVDIMKRVNKNMHGDNPQWYQLPENRETAAQYLLLYEMSLPYGLDLNNQVNIDKSASRLTVILSQLSQKQIAEFIDRSDAWITTNMPEYMHSKATGIIVMFVHMTIRNIQSMLGGTALAFALIALTLIFTLRSIRLGLISLIPNFLPVLFTFGVWGLFVGQIGVIASIITATSLGLIVDDTVHILSKYNRLRHSENFNVHNAIQHVFSHVGKALWVTTAVLLTGFLVLTFSSFTLNVDLGLLTAITVGIALFMDFFLLAPLLMLLDKNKSRQLQFSTA